MTDKMIKNKIASLRRRKDRVNEKLIELSVKYGTKELYLDKSSTCIGKPEFISPIEVISESTCHLLLEHKLGKSTEKWYIRPEKDEDGEIYVEGAYEFVDDLNWYKKCINAAEKFYQSEEPDRFLESDGDEDE